MLINTAILSDVFIISLWNFFKLALMSSIFFYWIPRRIFPQTMIYNTLDRIMFNIIYMVGFIMATMPALIYLHIFSLPLFLLLLILLKAFFVRYIDKQSFFDRLVDRLRGLLIKTLDMIDNFYTLWKSPSVKHSFHLFEKFENVSYVVVTRWVLTWLLFGYITYIIALGGFISYADGAPDVAQFVEWVASLNNNVLFQDNKTFGADFYGQASIVFFFQKITNIDSIVLFNIYPALLVLFLLFGLYYVVYKLTRSPYSALFSVVLFGIVFLSPAADLFLGHIYSTSQPTLFEWSGMKFHLSWLSDFDPDNLKGHLFSIAYIPYERYSSGLAYEFSSSFFLLNIYFMSTWFITKKQIYLILYGLTVFLIFTFHGGGAFYIVAADTLIFLAAIVFRQVSWKMFMTGLLVVIIASIWGNLWILSMIKYGLPQDFGAAAPFLDKLFETKKSISSSAESGAEIVTYAVTNIYQISIVFLMLLLPLMSLLKKQKFLFLAFSMSIIAVMLIYFATNLGLPRAAKHARAAEYLLLVFALGGGMYFSLLVVEPLRYFYRSYAKHFVLVITFMALVVTVIITPRWIDGKRFMMQTNAIEYNDLALLLYNISRKHRSFTWTVVSYVQIYPKVLGKGFHINTHDFLFDYNPNEHYLEIPTEWTYIFVENVPNPYMGMHEWHYRWRSDIHEQLKLWIEHYRMTHDNISIYLENEIVTVYKIDNRDYIKYTNQLLMKERTRSRNAVH